MVSNILWEGDRQNAGLRRKVVEPGADSTVDNVCDDCWGEECHKVDVCLTGMNG